ncbi:unnamed protein product [Trichobilharzia szidati]|nr:unnamed protein product [Trichobilharzia szidati]
MRKYRITVVNGKNKILLCRDKWLHETNNKTCTEEEKEGKDENYDLECSDMSWKTETCEILCETGSLKEALSSIHLLKEIFNRMKNIQSSESAFFSPNKRRRIVNKDESFVKEDFPSKAMENQSRVFEDNIFADCDSSLEDNRKIASTFISSQNAIAVPTINRIPISSSKSTTKYLKELVTSLREVQGLLQKVCDEQMKILKHLHLGGEEAEESIQPRYTSDEKLDDIKLPIKTMDMLQEFDRRLCQCKSYYEQIMSQMSLKVQNNISKSTRRLLSSILDTNLARLMTYKGTVGKIGIRRYTFYTLIVDVIMSRQLDTGGTKEEISKGIVKATKDWFHDQRVRRKKTDHLSDEKMNIVCQPGCSNSLL